MRNGPLAAAQDLPTATSMHLGQLDVWLWTWIIRPAFNRKYDMLWAGRVRLVGILKLYGPCTVIINWSRLDAKKILGMHLRLFLRDAAYTSIYPCRVGPTHVLESYNVRTKSNMTGSPISQCEMVL